MIKEQSGGLIWLGGVVRKGREGTQYGGKEMNEGRKKGRREEGQGTTIFRD